MHRPPIGIEHALVHHLAQGRMREHRVHQIRLGRLELPRQRISLQSRDWNGSRQIAVLLLSMNLYGKTKGFRLIAMA